MDWLRRNLVAMYGIMKNNMLKSWGLGIALGFLLGLISPTLKAEFKEWNSVDQKLFKSYIGFQLIDIGQTIDLINCQRKAICPIYETNSFIGYNPKLERLIITKTLGTYATYKLLDSNNTDTRKSSLIFANLLLMGIIINNHKHGLRFEINF
tara:strand:+ start:625 stop:1080 length:456 start_codon:yes stop_codon:yes gene_type:complete